MIQKMANLLMPMPGVAGAVAVSRAAADGNSAVARPGHDIWLAPSKRPKPRAATSHHQPPPAEPASSKPVTAPVRIPVVRNGYEYEIVGDGRTRRVSGILGDNKTPVRSRTAQTQAGSNDRRSTDDGGHYVAARFNGPTDAFNHFAQDANFNRGGYRALEDQWARAKRDGKTVVVKIVPMYSGSSKRPSVIDVSFTINGRQESLRYPNERKKIHSGKR